MQLIDIRAVKEKDIVRIINYDKTLFDGQIIKISSDFIGISINTKQNTYRELKKDQFIELILVAENEVLRCCSIILGSRTNNIEQILIISIPKIILSIERREFERIPIIMELEYSRLPEGLNYKSLNSVDPVYLRLFKKTYTVDISAGGIKIVIPKNDIGIKSTLLSISIMNEKIITLCSKLRTDLSNDSTHSMIAFKYEDMEKRHRQLILDFVKIKSDEINSRKLNKSLIL